MVNNLCYLLLVFVILKNQIFLCYCQQVTQCKIYHALEKNYFFGFKFVILSSEPLPRYSVAKNTARYPAGCLAKPEYRAISLR